MNQAADFITEESYRLELRIKNNMLYQMMRTSGYKTVAEMSRGSGIPQTEIGKAMNLKISAYNKLGNLCSTYAKLCDFLMCELEDICPPEHRVNRLENNFFASAVGVEELIRIENESPSKLIEHEEASSLVMEGLSELTPREERVIKLRFGLGGEEASTFDDIANEMGVTRERIRHIEIKALRKMHDPKKAGGKFVLASEAIGISEPDGLTPDERKEKEDAVLREKYAVNKLENGKKIEDAKKANREYLLSRFKKVIVRYNSNIKSVSRSASTELHIWIERHGKEFCRGMMNELVNRASEANHENL